MSQPIWEESKKDGISQVKTWRLDVWEGRKFSQHKGGIDEIANKLGDFYGWSYCEMWDEIFQNYHFKGSVKDLKTWIRDIAGRAASCEPINSNQAIDIANQAMGHPDGQDKPATVQGGDSLMPVLNDLKTAVAALTVDVKELKMFKDRLRPPKSITITCHESSGGRASQAWF